MPLVVLGASGSGLVWGWLIGGLRGYAYRFQRTLLVLSGASFLFATEVLLLANGWGLALFLTTAILSLLLHLLWQHMLRSRFNPAT